MGSHLYQPAEMKALSLAIRKTGRPMVLSISPGPAPISEAVFFEKYAQMWRISDDFWDFWNPSGDQDESQTLHGQFATAASWAPNIEPGHWPDADMLPIGYIGPRPGLGSARQTRFTHDEQRALLTLWSIVRSPLIIGGDLPHSDEWTTSLLTNPEVIAVNQHSTGNRPLITANGTVIWSARSEDGRSHYLAIFNRGESRLKIDLGWNEVGLVSGEAYNLRDLWNRKDLSSATSLELALQPHACVLYRASD